MTGAVSSRGQITIDAKARQELGVEPGMLAYQRVVSGHLEVIFLPRPHRRSLAGALHRSGEALPPLTGEGMEQAVMEALANERDPSD
jgi:bifunctional DNA-binding transcriptional regulator/antitoxin component of YhaV-PrlF toxin-antitoxin module